MPQSDFINQRILELGQEIFERADAARPRPWQRAFWLERMTHAVDADEQLKSRAFQFVDCLPALVDDASLARHLREYLDYPGLPLPDIARLAFTGADGRAGFKQRLLARLARYGAVQMAGRFISGYDARSAVRCIEGFRAAGMTFTMDVLGEATTSFRQADRYLEANLNLIRQLAARAQLWSPVPLLDEDAFGPMPRVNVSIKLTNLDPHFDAIDPPRSIQRVSERLRPLFRQAREVGAFINVDMEAFRYRDITLDLFKSVLMEKEFRDWEHVGIVVQAYLRDGEDDLRGLLEWGQRRGTRFAIRLVKGAYWDAETAAAVRSYKTPPVWSHKWQSDVSYERLTRIMLEHARLIHPAFASHNVRSLACVMATAEELGLSPRHYELQMLYGMGDPLKQAVVEMGRCLRVYAPYGELMTGMAYLIRRLLENTSNESFLKQSFAARGTHARLLADPDFARPPSGPLPARHYVNTNLEEPMSSFRNAPLTNFADAVNRRKFADALASVRRSFGRTYPAIIDDEPVETRAWFESRNPSRPSEVVGRTARATTAHADAAVAAARRAFARWSHATARERGALLHRLADELEARRFDLAATMVLEVGKPWREADADVTEAIDHCRFYAEQIVQIESRPRRRNVPGENNTLLYLPKGVCAVLSPWSFPLAILAGMTSAALAAGNCVILKSSSHASVLAAKLMQALQDVGAPRGVVNYLPGEGAVVGAHLVQHGDVNVVAFTGSSEIGAKVLAAGATVRPGQGFIRKMIVEMGGKNAIIVDDDADLDGAVQGVIESAFGYAGQKCSACSRVIVLPGNAAVFLSRLAEAVDSLTIGPADAPATFVGPIIDATHRDRVLEYLDIGRREGRLLVQAELPAECGEGYFVPPTVFDRVPPEARLAQEEIFGPVLTVLHATNFDDALRIAGGVRYALTGGLYSRSPAHIDQAEREFAVGNLYINRKITGSQVDVQPFGGFKLSGTGVKAGSPDYILHFMDARCIAENTLRSGFVPKEEETAAHS